MTFTLEVPDELVSVVAAIVSAKQFPDDDGLTESRIMTDEGITPEQFVQADATLDKLNNEIFSASRSFKAGVTMNWQQKLGVVDEYTDVKVFDENIKFTLRESRNGSVERELHIDGSIHGSGGIVVNEKGQFLQRSFEGEGDELQVRIRGSSVEHLPHSYDPTWMENELLSVVEYVELIRNGSLKPYGKLPSSPIT